MEAGGRKRRPVKWRRIGVGLGLMLFDSVQDYTRTGGEMGAVGGTSPREPAVMLVMT